MEKRELIAMFMESPFYFDLRLRERLALVQQSQRRFSVSAKAGPADLDKQAGKGSFDDGANSGEAASLRGGFNPRG